MKYTFAIACLLSTTSAILLNGEDDKKKEVDPIPWQKDTLPDCPKDKKRTVMDDRKTHIVKYPMVGATCKIQVKEQGITLIQVAKDAEPVAELAAPVAELNAAPPAELAAPKTKEADAAEAASESAGAKAVKVAALNKSEKKPTEEVAPVVAEPTGAEAKMTASADPALKKNVKKFVKKLPTATAIIEGEGTPANMVAPAEKAAATEEKAAEAKPAIKSTKQEDQELTPPAEAKDAASKPSVKETTAPVEEEKPNLTDPNARPAGWRTLNFNDTEICPDFDERMTLKNGRTYAVPYPRSGWNCHSVWGSSK